MNKLCWLSLLSTFMFLLPSNPARAMHEGCHYQPIEAIAGVDRLIKSLHSQGEANGTHFYEVPNLLPITSYFDFQKSVSSEGPAHQIEYEAIVRPRKTEIFDLFHLIIFKLDRARHLMYICVNHNSDRPQESHLTIYFLKAFGLEAKKNKLGGWLDSSGDWLFGPGGFFHSDKDAVVELASIPAELTPFYLIANGTTDLTEGIPFVEQVFKVPGTALELTGASLNRINGQLGAGIERIVITPEKIEIANRVDIEHPEKANVIFEQSLKTPEK